MSASIRLQGLTKRFGGFTAVHPLDLDIEPGELLVLLGPSGCGKTTTLRMLAGLETPSEGRILLDGRDVTGYPPSRRDVAFVFQLYALYPHLSVQENIAFPLRAQGRSAGEARREAQAMLARLGLAHLSALKPRRLSGADQQRVSLARALVRHPKAFLLDEPLNTLAAAQREYLRAQLRELQREMGATTVFVTHDQAEAMALGDRIAVMNEGRIVQCGPPRQVYDHPCNLFVAHFLGMPGMNFMPALRQADGLSIQGADLVAQVAQGVSQGPAGAMPGGSSYPASGGPALDTDFSPAPADPEPNGAGRDPGNLFYLGVRPEYVLLTAQGAPCQVEHTEVLGAYNLVDLRLGKNLVKARVPAGQRYRHGDTVGVLFHPDGCRWFDSRTSRVLPWKTLEVLCPAMR